MGKGATGILCYISDRGKGFPGFHTVLWIGRVLWKVPYCLIINYVLIKLLNNLIFEISGMVFSAIKVEHACQTPFLNPMLHP